MRFLIATSIAIVTVLCNVAVAQTPADAATCKPPGCERPKIVSLVKPDYTDADKASGAHGEVTVKLFVHADGSVSETQIVESSHSANLDAAALAAVIASRFQAARIDGKPVDMQAVVTFEFAKDSMVDLPKKTCADLNADVAFYQRAFPGTPLNKMRIALLSSGTIMMARGNGDIRSQMTKEILERRREAFERTAAWCAQNPAELFFKRFIQESS